MSNDLGYISNIDYLNGAIYHNPVQGHIFDVDEDSELLEQLIEMGYWPYQAICGSKESVYLEI